MSLSIAGFEDILGALSEGIAQVEVELQRLTESPVQTVADIGRHTLSAGGKRLRPAFVSLAARATGRQFEEIRAVKLGAAMELVHMATLIHDDVIDNAGTRRGRATAAALYGNTASILAGDVMLARAMVVLAEDGDLDVIRTVSRAVVEMAEGEALEVETRGVFDLTEEAHLRILRMKTAAFVQGCCEVGALIARADPDVRQALADYGHNVGMAFQIIDDVLDFRGETEVTGKPKATDFREGCATLPLIRLRGLASSDEEAHLRGIFGNGVTDDDIRDLCRLLEGKGAYREAEATADAHVEKAIQAVEVLPGGESRDLLEAIAQFVVTRQA